MAANTIPPIVVKVQHAPAVLADGDEMDFTMWLGPLPVRWTAEHTRVDALYGFTDTQIHGPFKAWVHRHSFNPLDENHT